MPSYDLTGTVKVVMPPQTFDSGFTKREFVVTTDDDRYPQDIKFECVKEKTALLDDIQDGQRVTVTFDVRGNEYNDRYFVNLTAWKVGAEAATAAGDRPTAEPVDGPPLDSLQPPQEEEEHMPF
jgi:single-strand DNA-binding protein